MMRIIFLLNLLCATIYHIILDEALGLWEPEFSFTLLGNPISLPQRATTFLLCK